MELDIASTAEGSTEYSLVSAIITSDRVQSEVEISAVVSEFVIYEHIEKPYLTMRLSFIDQINIVQTVDFQGGEKLSIVIKQIEEVQTGNEIRKDFVIDEIEKVIKLDERNETVVIHCTEYHMFEAAAQNVNKSYSGSPSSIINSLISSYINKSLVIDGTDSTKNLKVIIPNLDPIDAALWIKNRSVTYNGLPFFLYSPLGVDNLVFKDLGKMLSEPVNNITRPYVYTSSLSHSSGESKLYSIIEYKYENSEELINLLRKGYVGASYSFYDVHRGISEEKHFDVDNVFKSLLVQNLLGGENSKYNYGPEYKIKGKNLSSYNSKVISKISSSGSYRGGSYNAGYRSYSDETLGGDHMKHITSKAIKGFLSKTPLCITVKGREFITGNDNYTLGKTIRVLFLDADPTEDTHNASKDLKKSGDYLIISAKHSFNGDKVTSELLCGKVASIGKEIAV
jgi:hypothetical protein